LTKEWGYLTIPRRRRSWKKWDGEGINRSEKGDVIMSSKMIHGMKITHSLTGEEMPEKLGKRGATTRIEDIATL